jgi:predicted transcriptional regulator
VNCKRKGTRLEHKTIAMLKAAGYTCTRSAASKGAFDVIAINPLGLRCVQVKANAWPGPVERESLRNAARTMPTNAIIEVWRWDDGARKPLIKSVDELGI